jgi:hypothetical protein
MTPGLAFVKESFNRLIFIDFFVNNLEWQYVFINQPEMAHRSQ